jgi:hypothetical protein
METKGTEFSVSLPELRVPHIQGDVQYTSDRTHASFPILFNVFRLNLLGVYSSEGIRFDPFVFILYVVLYMNLKYNFVVFLENCSSCKETA